MSSVSVSGHDPDVGVGSDIVELANGTLLLFSYGRATVAASVWDIRVSKSTDGYTWTHLANVALAATYSANCVEPQAVLEDNGTIYLTFHLEDAVPSTVKYAKSTDSGATWSVGTWVTTAENRQGLATTLSGVGLSVAYYVTGTAFYYRESLDRGRTWGSAVQIDTISDIGYAAPGRGLWTMPVTLAGSGLSQNIGFIYGAENNGQTQGSIFYRQFSGIDGLLLSVRSTSDAWAWSDSAARQVARPRTAADTWAWSDSAPRLGTRARTTSDAWAWSDSVSRSLALAASTQTRTTSDAWTWSDGAARTVPTGTGRTTADLWAWSDVVTRTVGTGTVPTTPAVERRHRAYRYHRRGGEW